MLLIRTKLRPSTIHGIGVFAAEPVKAGTIIWRFVKSFDRLIPKEAAKKWPATARKYLDLYASLEDGEYLLDGDNARFMNHSENPNVVLIRGSGLRPMRASRDIESGEELTCDYEAFDEVARSGRI